MPAGSAQTFDARSPFWKPTVTVAPPSNGVITNLAFSTIVGAPAVPFSVVIRRVGQDPVISPGITAEVIRVTTLSGAGVVTAGSRNYAGTGALTILPGDEVYQYIGETLDEFNNVMAGSTWISNTNPATYSFDYSFNEGPTPPNPAPSAFALRLETILGSGAVNSAGYKVDMKALAAAGSGLTASQSLRGALQNFNITNEGTGVLGYIDYEQTGGYFDNPGGPYGNAMYAINRGNSVKASVAVSVSSASPAVVTLAAHGLMPGTPVWFQGAPMPTGMTAGVSPGPTDWDGSGTTYYVSATGVGVNTFQLSTNANGTGAAVNTSSTGTGVTMIASQDDWLYGRSQGARINNEAGFRVANGLLVGGAGHEALGYLIGVNNQAYRYMGYLALTSPVWKSDDAIPFVSSHVEDLAGADTQVAMLNNRIFGAVGDSLEWLIGASNFSVLTGPPDLTTTTKIAGGLKWRAFTAGGMELVTTLQTGGDLGRSNAVRTLRGDGTFVGSQVALPTNAIVGHMYIPTCAGVPTGAPTAFTGQTAIIKDSSAGGKFYVYDTSSSAWVAQT